VPRKAPDGKGVIEHRITLGDYERREFKQSMDAYQLNRNIRTGLIAGGLGLVAYVAYKIIPGFFDLFELDPDQQAIADRLFGLSPSPNSDYPEWAIYGIPKDREQLEIMYSQNVLMLQQKLEKNQDIVTVYENMPSGFAKNMLTKGYLAAREYVNEKHTKLTESLELWKAYYYEKLG